MQRSEMEQGKKPGSLECDHSLTAYFYTEYGAKLLSYIHRHVGVASDAEDILFEVFVVVIQREQELALLSFDEQRAWIWTVARNKIVDSHRRAKRSENIPLESVEGLLDRQWHPEQITLWREEQQHLHKCVQSLPPLQQEVLYLRFIGGLHSVEIAEIIHKSDAAVRKLISRTLAILRVNFERQSEGR